jgi:hypothetical protein
MIGILLVIRMGFLGMGGWRGIEGCPRRIMRGFLLGRVMRGNLGGLILYALNPV